MSVPIVMAAEPMSSETMPGETVATGTAAECLEGEAVLESNLSTGAAVLPAAAAVTDGLRKRPAAASSTKHRVSKKRAAAAAPEPSTKTDTMTNEDSETKMTDEQKEKHRRSSRLWREKFVKKGVPRATPTDSAVAKNRNLSQQRFNYIRKFKNNLSQEQKDKWTAQQRQNEAVKAWMTSEEGKNAIAARGVQQVAPVQG